MLRIVDRVMDVPLDNDFGSFNIGAYRTINDEKGTCAEHFLLYLDLHSSPCNLRINSACYTGDIFGDSRCDCNWQLAFTFQYIQQKQQGLILYHMHHEGRANGILEKLRSFDSSKHCDAKGAEAYRRLGLSPDARQFQSSVLILEDLGIKSVNLVSNNPRKKEILEKNGIAVVNMISVVSNASEFSSYYKQKREDFNHYV